MLKKILIFIYSLVTILISSLLGLITFSLLTVYINEYLAVLCAIAIFSLIIFIADKYRLKIFSLNAHKKKYFRMLSIGLFSLAMIYIFWIPTKTFESTNSVVTQYNISPEIIKTNSGEQIAVYKKEPKKSNGQAPILYVCGGPGAYPLETEKFLNRFSELGYTVYTFDPLGTRRSPLPKSTSHYTIANEVKVVNDIVDHYNLKKVNLIASSYGGNVSTRFIEKHPEKVNAYMAIDTAPIYSMDYNYPEQAKESRFIKSMDEPRIQPNKKHYPSFMTYTSWKQLTRIGYGLALMEIFKMNDIPYGNYNEYDYFNSLIAGSSSGEIKKGGKSTIHFNFMANRNITASLDESVDFTKNLKEIDTPPVLVVQPEYGIVPWQLHYQFKDYFDKTQFLAVSGAPHRTWVTQEGEDKLVKNGDALFHGEKVPDGYQSSENPFPPLKK